MCDVRCPAMECGRLLEVARRRGLGQLDYGQAEELCYELVMRVRGDRRALMGNMELLEACIECLWGAH